MKNLYKNSAVQYMTKTIENINKMELKYEDIKDKRKEKVVIN
jgi:hypothetical protein